MSTTVIRFGALGDLCIGSWFLAGLARRSGTRPLTLITKEQFRDLVAEIPGVDRVVTLPSSGMGGLLRLSREFRTLDHGTVLDAHGVLRSRLLTLLSGHRAEARLAKDTVARLRLLRDGAKRRADDPALHHHLLDRYDLLVGGTPGRDLLAAPDSAPLLHLRANPLPKDRVVGLAPGARWPTKRWPDDRVHAVAVSLLAEGIPLRIYLGPDESAWFDASPLHSLGRRADVDIVRVRDLVTVARSLASCRTVLCNDSGLLHLSEAVGTPVVAVFGPTVRSFGYMPLLPMSRLIETELSCRPCSRTGSRPCHRGDLACLTGIEPAVVAAEIRSVMETRT